MWFGASDKWLVILFNQTKYSIVDFRIPSGAMNDTINVSTSSKIAIVAFLMSANGKITMKKKIQTTKSFLMNFIFGKM